MNTRALLLIVTTVAALAPTGRAQGQSSSETPTPNLKPVAVLSQLDIDQDGNPDNAPDTDGDGLPDNWESGGQYASYVLFSAPTAISPGTPSTFILARQFVTTDANNRDTDGDGLSDFVEVFGLKYIDEYIDGNQNGILDSTEWNDNNNDGLPSIGEYPIKNSPYDFDGFVFTDPRNPDTDGDGIPDGADMDPLINPATFNTGLAFAQSSQGDKDEDGLGDLADFANDRDKAIDNPVDIDQLLKTFRTDLYNLRILPEAVIEDLIGADWDGNGLFRVTDVRDWTPVVSAVVIDKLPQFQKDLFYLGDRKLFAEQSEGSIKAYFDRRSFGKREVGIGYQLLLAPSGGGSFTTSLMPDPRIWTILYAWRVPGFDADGNGFTGVPSAARGVTAPKEPNSNIAAVVIKDKTANFETKFDDISDPSGSAFDDRIDISNLFDPQLDGRIDVPRECGMLGSVSAVGTMLGLFCMSVARRKRP